MPPPTLSVAVPAATSRTSAPSSRMRNTFSCCRSMSCSLIQRRGSGYRLEMRTGQPRAHDSTRLSNEHAGRGRCARVASCGSTERPTFLPMYTMHCRPNLAHTVACIMQVQCFTVPLNAVLVPSRYHSWCVLAGGYCLAARCPSLSQSSIFTLQKCYRAAAANSPWPPRAARRPSLL